jgi:hypothetical protein
VNRGARRRAHEPPIALASRAGWSSGDEGVAVLDLDESRIGDELGEVETIEELGDQSREAVQREVGVGGVRT